MSQGPRDVSELEGVLAATDLVEFQAGAVVSRTLVKKPTGTVTVFAFAAGEPHAVKAATPFKMLLIMIRA